MSIHNLPTFTQPFLGNGNLSAPVWLIGLAEGGGQDVLEIEHRIRVWNRRESRPVEERAGFHREAGATRLFEGPRPARQRIGLPLTKTLQADRAAPVDDDTLRHRRLTTY